jgi:hypothetical protein
MVCHRKRRSQYTQNQRPILCFALAAALVLLGGLAAILGRVDLLFTSFVPVLIFTLIGLILRNAGGRAEPESSDHRPCRS